MNYSELANQIVAQKTRYWLNTLSKQAIEDNFFTMLSNTSYYNITYDLTIYDSVFSSIFMGLTYGTPLGDLSTFNLCYDVSTATTEEYLNGKFLDIQQVNCLDKYPSMGIWLSDMFTYLSSHFGIMLPVGSLVKGYYDQTLYGYSYYDPDPVKYFVRSTAIKEAKRYTSGRSTASIFQSFIDALDMDYSSVDDTYKHLIAFNNAKINAAFSEYSWADKSTVLEETDEKIPIPTKTLDGSDDIIESYSMGNLWLDLLAKRLGIDVTQSIKEGLPQVKDVPDPSKRADIAIAETIAKEQKMRLIYTPILVANYQRPEEMDKPHSNRRVDVYGQSRVIYYNIKQLIESDLKDLSKYMRNLYITAVQQLYARLTREGGWGNEAYRTMGTDELKSQWIQEWVGKGLDPNILDKLFSKAMDAVKYGSPLRSAAKLKQIVMYGG